MSVHARILLAEPDAELRTAIARALRADGHAVEEAADGTDLPSADRSAEQLEVLREQREKLAGRADRRDPSPDIAREKPVEALQSALESLRVAEKELRQQNEDLLAAQRALEDERRRYQGLFEFAPCGYVVTDAFGIIQEMNRTAELLFNHRRESLRRKPLVVLFPREARPSFLSHLHRLLRRGAREVAA